MTRQYLILPSIFAAACGGTDLSTHDACNPLGGSACVTPWPSSLYEKDDATTQTKRKLAIPKGALPKNFDGIEVNPEMYNDQDGFSYAAPAMIAFETGVDGSSLMNAKQIEMSVTAASPTVIIDMSTGELVHHFAELDAREPDKIASQALYIRPAKLLKPATQYAVAIKKTLKAKDGSDLPISEGFQAILDGEETNHEALERIRPRFKDIFAKLEAKGIAKEDLVVAWDFTTRSRANVQNDLYYAREAALAAMGENAANLSFKIDSDTVPGDTRFARQIHGTFTAPMFLTMEGYGPNVELRRDSQGRPTPMGTYDVPFSALVPQCALDANAPVPVIEYGHGLLGDAKGQVSSGGSRAAGAEICAILIGTDMRGMSAPDVPNVALALNDNNMSGLVFDVLVQGMINHVILVQLAKTKMAAELFVKPNNGPSMVDPSRIYWYGISQGGIMGTTVCGIDPEIKRCVIQVNAINYSMMLERSLDWPTYRTTLIGAYDDPLIVALMLNLMQNEWDRTEPVSVADVITGEGFPGTPPKQVLMQVAIADDEVPNVASEHAMRSMNIPIITPSPHIPFGVEQAATAPSGAVWYDYGLASTIPLTNTPPPPNDVHSQIRNKKATTEMMKKFYAEGVIQNLCTAPNGCDCTVAGACGEAL
jgi:hypothetical protein